MVLLEAAAMNVPSISSNIIGCNEIIISGENGELVNPKDEDSLYNAMESWLNDRGKVISMSSKCRQLAYEKFEQHYVWSNLLDEYKRLISSI